MLVCALPYLSQAIGITLLLTGSAFLLKGGVEAQEVI